MAIDLTLAELDTLTYHLRVIATETGARSMAAHRRMAVADVLIEPTGETAIWDQVTINGHSCGNRCGGARAYARLAAGDPEWFRAR